MMKAMDSARGQGANHSNAKWHCEDLQRCHRVEDALSCFDTSVPEYLQVLSAEDLATLSQYLARY
jgi:hypothetical protein